MCQLNKNYRCRRNHSHEYKDAFRNVFSPLFKDLTQVARESLRDKRQFSRCMAKKTIFAMAMIQGSEKELGRILREVRLQIREDTIARLRRVS